MNSREILLSRQRDDLSRQLHDALIELELARHALAKEQEARAALEKAILAKADTAAAPDEYIAS